MIDTVVHAVHVHLTSKAGDDESENVKVRARARYRCRDTTHIQTDRHTPHNTHSTGCKGSKVGTTG